MDSLGERLVCTKMAFTGDPISLTCNNIIAITEFYVLTMCANSCEMTLATYCLSDMVEKPGL